MVMARPWLLSFGGGGGVAGTTYLRDRFGMGYPGGPLCPAGVNGERPQPSKPLPLRVLDSLIHLARLRRIAAGWSCGVCGFLTPQARLVGLQCHQTTVDPRGQRASIDPDRSRHGTDRRASCATTSQLGDGSGNQWNLLPLEARQGGADRLRASKLLYCLTQPSPLDGWPGVRRWKELDNDLDKLLIRRVVVLGHGTLDPRIDDRTPPSVGAHSLSPSASLRLASIARWVAVVLA